MQMELTVEEDGSRLSLIGEFSLIDIEQIKSDLAKALETAQRVIVDTKGLAAIDVACLQLLHAAYASAQSRGKEIVIESSPAEAFKLQIARSGLIHGQDGGIGDKSEYKRKGGDD